MHVTASPSRTVLRNSKRVPGASVTQVPVYAREEINAYIAIRDQLLQEAETTRTPAKLDSVIIANDFVAGCLNPAKSPYEVQCLPEAAAKKERKRCDAVNNRVAVLRKGAA